MKRTFVCMTGLLTACSSTPLQPHMAVPQHWSQTLAPVAAKTVRVTSLWERFQSAELHTLLHLAETQSFDNAAASARRAQQEALARVARAPLYPTLQADVSLTAQSQNSKSLGSISGGFLDTGLSAAYELDVWGKNSARAASAKSLLHASQFELASSRLAVAAGVADTYFEILSLRERAARAKANLETTQRVLEVVESRERAGMARAREVAQQRGLVAAAAANHEQLMAAESSALVTLALASGRDPAAMHVEASDLSGVSDPGLTAIDLDVPTRLLRHRPDVARAEASLAASHADVTAARAAFLPQLRLLGQAAFQYTFLSQYYDGAGLVYTGTLGLSQPIFDGGLLNAERDAAAARRSEAEVNYQRTVLQAVSEVERALRQLGGLQKQYEQQQTQVEEARRAFSLVELEFKAGGEDMLAVLDAQRSLIQAEDGYCQTRLGKLRAAVALVSALGAGWTRND